MLHDPSSSFDKIAGVFSTCCVVRLVTLPQHLFPINFCRLGQREADVTRSLSPTRTLPTVLHGKPSRMAQHLAVWTPRHA